MIETQPLPDPQFHSAAAQGPQVRSSAQGLRSGLGLLVGLAAGLTVWGAFAVQYPWIKLPEDLAAVTLYSPPKLIAARDEALGRLVRLNPVISLALWGFVLGGFLGLGEGLARRSARIATTAIAACALGGVVFGGVAGLLGYLVFVSYKPAGLDAELVKTLGLQTLMLGTLGAGIGLTLGAVRRTIRTAVLGALGGLLAGALAAMLHTFLAAWLFPAVITEVVIPAEHANRLAWLVLGSGLLGAVIPSLLGRTHHAGA